MDKYKIYDDIKATEGHKCDDHSIYERRDKNWRSGHRQWDYIICTVCTGCGKPLTRYENLRGLAFCVSCREILFPETVPRYKSRGQRFPYPRSRGHFL